MNKEELEFIKKGEYSIQFTYGSQVETVKVEVK